MQMFRPRSWRVRSDAAEARARKEESLHDLHAVRASLFHGEEPPAHLIARLEDNERALKANRGGPVPPTPAEESEEMSTDEAKRLGGRSRRG